MLSRCFENKNEQNGQEYFKTDSTKDPGYHDRGFALLPTYMQKLFQSLESWEYTNDIYKIFFFVGTIRRNRKDKIHKT